jgi:hypothetical protein
MATLCASGSRLTRQSTRRRCGHVASPSVTLSRRTAQLDAQRNGESSSPAQSPAPRLRTRAPLANPARRGGICNLLRASDAPFVSLWYGRAPRICAALDGDCCSSACGREQIRTYSRPRLCLPIPLVRVMSREYPRFHCTNPVPRGDEMSSPVAPVQAARLVLSQRH